MTPRKTLIFFALIFFSFSLFGQSKKIDTPNLKGTTHVDYYVTVKLVDKEPKFKPTYLFATKVDPKQKKWDLDTNKINIDNYFLTNKNVHHVGYSKADCACDLFGDTTGNGVMFVHLKTSLKLLTVQNFIETANISYGSLDKHEIYINGRQIVNDNVLVDSEAEIIPIYKKGKTESKDAIIGVEIWTLTKEQRNKYGM
jgi:hypothetical protein